ncbi:hypothetical protein IC582_016824 [Cucumis melo]
MMHENSLFSFCTKLEPKFISIMMLYLNPFHYDPSNFIAINIYVRGLFSTFFFMSNNKI